MDEQTRSLEKQKEHVTLQKEIEQQRAEKETLKAAERQAKQAYGGSGWQQAIGFVKGMTNSEKLHTLKSAGFGSDLRELTSGGGGSLEHLRKPNDLRPPRLH